MVLVVAATLVVALTGAMEGAGPAPSVTVREERGVYSVSARFHVAQPPAVALAVLTDYENIPRFLPDVTSSVVRERSVAHAVVEQEAVSRMMMFSKKVHLLLEITEEGNAIRFRDRSGRSFERYEGSWRVAARGRGSDVTYELTAKPGFEVPDFILRRLLKRDSTRTIERLAAEITTRGTLLTTQVQRDPPLDRGNRLFVP
ncbi:MAG TPA: SRPBCC family protein [Vicinamibacterales bacterium]|nr:SRPBCC family protein [Vicinamibacterales bacterium]